MCGCTMRNVITELLQPTIKELTAQGITVLAAIDHAKR